MGGNLGVTRQEKNAVRSIERGQGRDIGHFLAQKSGREGNHKMERKRVKFALRMAPETQALVKKMMAPDNCQSQNEFIEKAIRFYAGYVSSQEATEYLPVALVSALRDTIDNSENRTARLLFKLAVEMDMMMNVLAVQMNVPEDDLAKLRNMCVRHVKETKGSISYKEAQRRQNGLA